MAHAKWTSAVLAAVAASLWAAAPVRGQTPAAVTVFEGALVITGDGSAPIENAAIVVTGDRITAVGRRGEVAAPAGAGRGGGPRQNRKPALIDGPVPNGHPPRPSLPPRQHTPPEPAPIRPPPSPGRPPARP